MIKYRIEEIGLSGIITMCIPVSLGTDGNTDIHYFIRQEGDTILDEGNIWLNITDIDNVEVIKESHSTYESLEFAFIEYIHSKYHIIIEG